MMDFFARPVSKRTRAKEAVFYKQLHEQIKRERATSSSGSGGGGGGGGSSVPCSRKGASSSECGNNNKDHELGSGGGGGGGRSCAAVPSTSGGRKGSSGQYGRELGGGGRKGASSSGCRDNNKDNELGSGGGGGGGRSCADVPSGGGRKGSSSQNGNSKGSELGRGGGGGGRKGSSGQYGSNKGSELGGGGCGGGRKGAYSSGCRANNKDNKLASGGGGGGSFIAASSSSSGNNSKGLESGSGRSCVAANGSSRGRKVSFAKDCGSDKGKESGGGGVGRSTAATSSEKVFVLLDDEDEEDETRRRGLKRQRNHYDRAREEPSKIQRNERAKEGTEKEEALRKVEEWRRVREEAEKGSKERESGGDSASVSARKGKSIMNTCGRSSEGGNAVHAVDAESDSSASTESYYESSSSDDSDNDDSGDEDFDLDKAQEEEEEGDEESDEDGEDTDDGIAYPFNHNTLVKMKRCFVDLEDELEEEKIRAEKHNKRKRDTGVRKFRKQSPHMNTNTESEQSFNKDEGEGEIEESTNQVVNEVAEDIASTKVQSEYGEDIDEGVALPKNQKIFTDLEDGVKDEEEENKSKRAKVSPHIDIPIEMVSESTAKSLEKDAAEEDTEELVKQVLEENGADIAPEIASHQPLDKDEAEEKLERITNQKSPCNGTSGLGKEESDSVDCVKESEDTKEDNSILVKRGRGRPKKVPVMPLDPITDKMLSESSAESLEQDEGEEETDELANQVGRKLEQAAMTDQLTNQVGRKLKQAATTDRLLNLFVNTIWDKGEVLQQEDEAAQNETTDPSEAETVIQYKFSYGVEKPVPKEKSDYEKELDQLWHVMDLALRSSEDGASTPSTDAVKEESEQPVEKNPYTSCSSGKHEPVLNEEIGLICMFCSAVVLERKYILPAFGTPCARGTQSRRTSVGNEESPVPDSFPLFATSGRQGSNLHTTGPVWDKLDKCPWIREKLYPHQMEGIEFLWKNLAGGIDLDVENMNPSHDVGGCIISHAPGTGKTLLTIAFLRTFMEAFPDCRPILMAPSSMLLTWEAEFKKWNAGIKFHNLSSLKFSGQEDPAARKLLGNRRSTSWRHLVKTFSWCKGNSILAVSYQLFEQLAAEEPGEDKEEIPGFSAEMRKIILEMPSLVILDEGHTPRNKSSKIYKCLKNLKTERRIILSGTPFQNNFDELYTTMWLVRPKFAETISSGTDKNRGNPSKHVESGEEARGNWVSLTSSIGKSSDDQRLEKTRKMIDPFVHVHKGSILQKKLPGLREYVVVLHPSPLQRKLLRNVREGMKNSFELDRAIALVSVHPSLLTKCKCSVAKRSKLEKSCATKLTDENQQIKEDAFRLNYHEGVKLRFLMQLIQHSEAMHEKVLVFSQFLDPHSLICDHLYSAWGWRMGDEIIQINGSLNVNKRQVLINRFNDPNSGVKVLLASTKACGEGISLTGASRLVLLDVVWNPSVQKQAISRAYRLGQQKVVYTYNLITSGTLEEDKYRVQSRKHHLSQLVFSTEHGKTGNHDDNPSSKLSDDKFLKEMMGNEELKGMFDKIITKESTLLET